MRNRLKSGRIVSVIICILLAMAMIPASALADNNVSGPAAAFNYVALGDGSTAGFGMAESAGYGVLTEGTYPAVVADSLRAKGLDVNVSQLAMKGMRTEELRFLLDDSYSGDAYLKETFPDLKNYREAYRSAVRNADLITYSLGTVNFGSYVLYVAGDAENRCSDPQVKALAAEDKDGVKADLKAEIDAQIQKIPAAIRSAAQTAGYNVDELVGAYTDQFVDAAAYVYYSFCLSNEESLKAIRAINPDADVIVLGLYNMLGDFTVDALGMNVNIGSLYYDNVIARVNSRIQNAEEAYAFVDTMDVHRFFNEVAEYDADTSHISQQFKDYCDVYEDDFLYRKDLDKKLKDQKDSIRTRGYETAYDVAEQSLKSVAGVGTESFDLSNLLYARDNMEAISSMGADLMAAIRQESMSYVDQLVKNKGAFSYKNKLKNFIDGTGIREGALYGKDKNMRKFGRVIMAVGMRTAMGDGFFQQPSAKGHGQLADSILESYKDRVRHYPASEASCAKPGSIEYWLKVTEGRYYSDASCSAGSELSPEQVFTTQLEHDYKVVEGTAADPTCTEPGKAEDMKCSVCGAVKEGEAVPALGHVFGKPVFKSGKNISTCSRCGGTKETVIPGASIKKLKAAKKAFTVTWNLPSKSSLKKITGYEIKYSLKSSMGSAKTVSITKNKTTSRAIRKLKAKKKYYVQIRAYQKSGSYKYYSAWSSKKTVKTK